MSATKIIIPEYINERIDILSESSNSLGDNIRELIENSLELKANSLDNESINSINNIFSNIDIRKNTIQESIQEMKSPISNSIRFWDSIIESGGLPTDYLVKINKIKSILEDAADAPKKESIEGDGEDPTKEDQPTQDGAQTVDG